MIESIGLLLFALLVWRFLPSHNAVTVISGAAVAWLMVSVLPGTFESEHSPTSLYDASDNRELQERLTRFREIKISVVGRTSGRTITIPVWFAVEEEELYLLPVHGSETQWYKNLLQNPSTRIAARGAEAEFRAIPLKESTEVKSVIEKFEQKYGTKDVKRYHSKP